MAERVIRLTEEDVKAAVSFGFLAGSFVAEPETLPVFLAYAEKRCEGQATIHRELWTPKTTNTALAILAAMITIYHARSVARVAGEAPPAEV